MRLERPHKDNAEEILLFWCSRCRQVSARKKMKWVLMGSAQPPVWVPQYCACVTSQLEASRQQDSSIAMPESMAALDSNHNPEVYATYALAGERAATELVRSLLEGG